MGIKDFVLKKMIETKMKDVPPAEQEMILNLIQKNPELFKKIALEMQEEIDKGKEQMAAAIQVMTKYKDEIQKIMGEGKKENNI